MRYKWLINSCFRTLHKNALMDCMQSSCLGLLLLLQDQQINEGIALMHLCYHVEYPNNDVTKVYFFEFRDLLFSF